MAFQFTVERFLKKESVFLWTFTFKRALNVSDARKLWSSANHRFRKSGLLVGVRAFELHRSHGLHIHLVTETWTPVDLVRRIWIGAATDFEGGRIHVCRAPADRASYLGKYLSKSKRPPCLKGVRLWAVVGRMDRTRVADIVRECRLTRAYQLARCMIPDFEVIPFHRRMSFVQRLAHNTLLVDLGEPPLPLPRAI